MSVRTQHGNEPTLYYITYTCYNWLHLFSIANAYDLIYKWFDYLKDSAQIKVTAYVIMLNHVHVILFFPAENYNLNTIISNAKRFMAYEIVNRLKQLNENNILQQLEGSLSERKKRKVNCIKFLKTVLMQNQFIRDNSCYKKFNIYILILFVVSGNL